MPFTIKKSDGTFLVTVQDQTIDQSATSLGLPGKGAAGYGASIAQNFAYLVDNFASTTAPARALTGQLWFDENTSLLRINVLGSWNLVGTDAFGVTLDTLPGPTIAGNIGGTSNGANRIGGATGVPLSINGAITTVSISAGEGKIIACASPETIPNVALPATITLEGRVFDFKARFPKGLVAGMTLATDAAGYLYGGTTQFSDILTEVPYSYSGDDTSGTANLLTVTVPATLTTIAKYLCVEVKVANTNTGACQINLNGLGLKNIVRRDVSQLQAGDLLVGFYYRMIYDGLQFRVDDAQANGYVGPTGPVGATGPTGAASTVQGPTGPTGSNASIVSGQGVSVTAGVASLSFNTLAGSPSSLNPNDLIAYYSSSANQHETTSFASFSSQVLASAQASSSASSAPIPNLVTITSSTTYTSTTGARLIVVRGVGGGGSGATSGRTNGYLGYPGQAGGGGASGAFVISIPIYGSPLTVNCVVGVGGVSPPAGAGAHGNPGTSTSFGVFATATGGNGGVNAGIQANFYTRGSGGTGGSAFLIGNADGYVIQGAAGCNATDFDGGQGGSTIFGGGGYGGNDLTLGVTQLGNGGDGGYGAGGGGSQCPGSFVFPLAGDGGPGFIEIWEFF